MLLLDRYISKPALRKVNESICEGEATQRATRMDYERGRPATAPFPRKVSPG